MAEKKQTSKQSSAGLTGNSFFKRNLHQVIIAAFAFVLYANSIGNDYNMDDQLVTNKHKLTSQGLAGIPQIISSPYYSDEQGYAYDYRPMVHISFAIENQFFGDNPHVGHFINVLLYMLCCVLLYRLLRNLLPVPDWVCLAGVLLFTVHPVHTEVVCSLKNRDELLSMLFAFLAFNFYRRFYEDLKWYHLLFSFLLISLSFLSKLSSASYAAFIPIALLLFKKQNLSTTAARSFFKSEPFFAILIAFITALSAVLIQPSVTVGNKLNTLLLLMVPVVLVAVVQRFSAIVLWLKSVKIKLPATSKDSTVTKQKEQGPKQAQPEKSEPETIEPVQSWYLFAASSVDDLSDWKKPKAWLLSLILIAISSLPFLFGSLLGSFVVLAGLMLTFLFSKQMQRWLSFCVLGIYIIVLYIVFPFLAHYFFSFSAMFFIAYMLHPKKHYSIAAAFLYAGLFAASVLWGIESQYNSLIILFGWALVRQRYGKIAAGITIALLSIIVVNIALHLSGIGATKLLERVVFGVAVGAGLYLAYARIDFSKYIKPLFVLMMAALISNTMLNQTDIGRNFFNRPFKFSLLYYNNARAVQQIAILASAVPQKLNETGHKLSETGAAISQARNKVADAKVEVFTVPTDRPLLYLEAPVGVTDLTSVRIGTSLAVLLHYAQVMVFPHPLSFYYGYKVIEPTALSNWKAILGLLIYLLLALLAVWSINSNKILSLGLWGYLLGIALFANYNNLIPGVVGDRYLLFPSVGFCIVLIEGIRYYAAKRKLSNIPLVSLPPIFKYGFGALLLLLSVKVWSRNADWKDKLTLFRHDLKNVSESAQAHNLLALELMSTSATIQNPAEQTQMRQEAVEQFKASINIYPAFFNSNYDLARAYALINMPDSAITYFQKSIPLNPYFTMAHLDIADIYMKQGRWQDAIPYLQTAIKMHPKDYRGYDKLSYVYFMLKDFGTSIQTNKNAIAQMPANAEPVTNIGRTFKVAGQFDSARYYIRKSDAMAPGNPVVQQLLRELGN